MVKIKGFRFECEVCQVKSSIQVFYRKDGTVGYARARHLGADKFFYHQQSIDYVNAKLGELSNIDLCQQADTNSIAQSKPQSSSFAKLVAGGKGFEPFTLSLEGCCSIRTELLAQTDSEAKTGICLTSVTLQVIYAFIAKRYFCLK